MKRWLLFSMLLQMALSTNAQWYEVGEISFSPSPLQFDLADTKTIFYAHTYGVSRYNSRWEFDAFRYDILSRTSYSLGVDGSFPSNISFIDAKHGFIGSFFTRDGGATWGSFNVNDWNMFFLDSNNALYYTIDTSGISIHHTDLKQNDSNVFTSSLYNGFKQPKSLFQPAATYATGIRCHFHFINDSLGFLLFNDSLSTYLAKTTDGGFAWTFDTIPISLNVNYKVGSGFTILSYLFVNESIGLIVGSGNWVYRTQDGGKSWQKIDLGLNKSHLMYSIVLKSNGGLMVAGTCSPKDCEKCPTEGCILTSSDNGLTWSYSDVNQEISKISEMICKNDTCVILSGNMIYSNIEYPKNEIPEVLITSSPISQVYPNPTDKILNVEISLPNEIISMMVYDEFGKLVRTFSSTNRIDVSALQSGMYIIKINGTVQDEQFKFVVD